MSDVPRELVVTAGALQEHLHAVFDHGPLARAELGLEFESAAGEKTHSSERVETALLGNLGMNYIALFDVNMSRPSASVEHDDTARTFGRKEELEHPGDLRLELDAVRAELAENHAELSRERSRTPPDVTTAVTLEGRITALELQKSALVDRVREENGEFYEMAL